MHVIAFLLLSLLSCVNIEIKSKIIRKTQVPSGHVCVCVIATKLKLLFRMFRWSKLCIWFIFLLFVWFVYWLIVSKYRKCLNFHKFYLLLAVIKIVDFLNSIFTHTHVDTHAHICAVSLKTIAKIFLTHHCYLFKLLFTVFPVRLMLINYNNGCGLFYC